VPEVERALNILCKGPGQTDLYTIIVKTRWWISLGEVTFKKKNNCNFHCSNIMKTVVILPLSSVVTECGNYSNACQLLKFRFEHRWASPFSPFAN
jgi:hypothetical protein